MGTIALFLTVTAPAAAHERWVKHTLLSEFDRSLFETARFANVATLVGVLLLGALLVLLSVRMRATPSTQPDRIARARDWGTMVLGLTSGLGLLLLVYEGRYAAPDLVVKGGEGDALLWLTGLVGLLMLVGFKARVAGWTSLLIFVWALVRRPFEPFEGEAISLVNVINYLDVIGISIYIGIVGRGRYAIDGLLPRAPEPSPAARAKAVGVLRLFLGGTLVVLGLQKFFVPELPMGVVQNYADKIYEPLHALTGVTPEVYVFTASVVETTVGIVLLLGVFTRTVMVVLFLLFATTTFIFKGDLVGHLPLAGIVVALFLEGGGSYRVDSLLLARRGARQSAESTGAAAAALGSSATVLLALLATTLLATSACRPSQGSESVSTGASSAEGRERRLRFTLETQPSPLVLNEFFTVVTTVEDLATGRARGGWRPVTRRDHARPTATAW